MRLSVLLAVLALACDAAPAMDDTPVASAEVDRAIALAAQYVVNSCGADGKFIYQIRTTDGRISPGYNIVRHAGAMYALAMLDAWQRDPRAEDALRRAAEFLRENYLRPGPVFHNTKTLAVWKSPPGQHGDTEATLGASGLGLVGLIGSKTTPPKSITPADLKALGQFLLFLKNKDGSFNSKYLAQDGGKFSAWGSLYYPGEAALALVSLYESDGSEKWLTAGENALRYLADSRAGAKDIPADHWAVIATAKLFSLRDRPDIVALREPLLKHAVQICESILADQIEEPAPSVLNGGFNRDGRTTPTSTRLEGLLAALEFLPPEQHKLRSRIEKSVHRGIQFLLKSQIQSGRYAGGIPEAIATAAPEIRIDYVQHFLCAMIRYRIRLTR